MHTSIIRITYIYIYLHMHQIQTRKGIQLKILVKHLFVTRQIGMFKLPFSPTVHNPLLQRRVIFKQALCHFSRWVRAQPCQPTSLSLKFGTPVPAPHPKRLEQHALFHLWLLGMCRYLNMSLGKLKIPQSAEQIVYSRR